MPDRLKIIAHFDALPGKTEELKQILIDLKSAREGEAGCTFFQLGQDETTPSSFIFIEEWDSQEHFDAHLKADHLKEARAKMAGVLSGDQDVRVYRVVEYRSEVSWVRRNS